MEMEPMELKLLVCDKEKVVFAECGSDFVDLLFALLSLRLSTVICLTHDGPQLGSLTKLYESVAKLAAGSFLSVNTKPMLLSAYAGKQETARFCHPFYCEACGSERTTTLRETNCNRDIPVSTNQSLRFLKRPSKSEDKETSVYVGGGLRFIVTDGLRVTPLSTESTLPLLDELRIEDCFCLRHQLFTVRIEELHRLLKYSLFSSRPLSDTLLATVGGEVISPCVSQKPIEKPRLLKPGTLPYMSMKVNMQLKLYFDRSSGNILYAESGEKFVDLLLSFLAYPLTNSIIVLREKGYLKQGVGIDVERWVFHPFMNTLSHLQNLALPVSDDFQISVKDVQSKILDIGKEEALTLLKASVRSESALDEFYRVCVEGNLKTLEVDD